MRKYNVGMSADVPRRGEDDGPRATAVTFRSVVEERPGQRLRELFDLWWPAYRRWFLRDGEQERSSYAGCLRAVRTHVPELVSAYEGLVELVGGGDLEARFLSLWDPPPFLAACSLAAWTRDGNPSLLRSYDYAPALCETTLLTTTISTRRTMAMSDCLWGALDGVNEDGLAVALAFGGRRAVGRGFAVTLLLRYMLEQCADVPQALEAVAAVPVNLSYNIALVDASGQAALVRVAPDRAPIVEHGGVCSGKKLVVRRGIPATFASRFDRAKNDAMAAMSHVSSCVKPAACSAAKSASSMAYDAVATLTAKSSIARSRGVMCARR